MMKITILGLAIVPVLLSGCAAMSLDECKTANWVAVGEKDGSNAQERRLINIIKPVQKQISSQIRFNMNKAIARGKHTIVNPRIFFMKH